MEMEQRHSSFYEKGKRNYPLTIPPPDDAPLLFIPASTNLPFMSDKYISPQTKKKKNTSFMQ